MSDYLHHVATRMLDEPATTDNNMLLAGKSIVFPTHINETEDDVSQSLVYPRHENPVDRGTEEHVRIMRIEERIEKPRQREAEVEHSYLQPRLRANEDEVASPSAKQISTPDDLAEVKYSPDSPLKEASVQNAELNTIERILQSEILKSEKTTSQLQVKETSYEKETLRPEFVQNTMLVPPEPILQKVPSTNKLTIGKITVEIIRPAQPQVKTKERVVTHVVSSPVKEGGTSKLSYGLRQF